MAAMAMVAIGPTDGVPSKKPLIEPTSKSGAKKSTAPAGVPNAKGAKFVSKQVTKSTPGHAVPVEADLTGAKELWLVVTDGGDGYGCDWADWVDPVIEGDFGTKKLTDLPWFAASSGFGQVRVNKNCGGQAMRVAGKAVSGIGVHANSAIGFKLPKGTKKFKAIGGLDEGGTKQTCGSTVKFMVFDKKPQFAAAAKRGGGANGDVDPANAVANLETHEALETTLFAHEPMMLSPSCMEIDDRGRIWVGEVVNYRRNKGKRPESISVP